jgi:hypothetical protein
LPIISLTFFTVVQPSVNLLPPFQLMLAVPLATLSGVLSGQLCKVVPSFWILNIISVSSLLISCGAAGGGLAMDLTWHVAAACRHSSLGWSH